MIDAIVSLEIKRAGVVTAEQPNNRHHRLRFIKFNAITICNGRMHIYLHILFGREIKRKTQKKWRKKKTEM